MLGKVFSPILFVFYIFLLWVILSGIIAQAGGCTWEEFIQREFSEDPPDQVDDSTGENE